MEKKNRKFSENATFAGIVTAIVGGIISLGVGVLLGKYSTEVKYHDVVTYNNISSYIDSLLVKPGMIDEDILLLDNPFDQINMIAETIMGQRETSKDMMNDQQLNYDNMLMGIRECLINLGTDKNIVDKYTQDELLNELADAITSLSTVSEENKELETKLENLKEQKTAILSSPNLKILGEDIDTTLMDYVATIDGHTYYSENLLNIFLPEKIVYVDEIVKYGEAVPERINVVSEKRIHDNSELLCYNGDSHFMMGLQEYSSGIVNNWYRQGSLKIACNEEYSQLSFTLGHVDNSGTDSTTLSISYMDSNGQYQETFFKKLNADMPVESFTIPIYNTRTVKIDIPYINTGQYGLADVYLIK